MCPRAHFWLKTCALLSWLCNTHRRTQLHNDNARRWFSVHVISKSKNHFLFLFIVDIIRNAIQLFSRNWIVVVGSNALTFGKDQLNKIQDNRLLFAIAIQVLTAPHSDPICIKPLWILFHLKTIHLNNFFVIFLRRVVLICMRNVFLFCVHQKLKKQKILIKNFVLLFTNNIRNTTKQVNWFGCSTLYTFVRFSQWLLLFCVLFVWTAERVLNLRRENTMVIIYYYCEPAVWQTVSTEMLELMKYASAKPSRTESIHHLKGDIFRFIFNIFKPIE